MSSQFTFFWKSSSPFSNWYMSSFMNGGITYNCAEQYMMYQKARLFKDFEVADLILEQTQPRKQKFLGRQVRWFNEHIWEQERESLMFSGLSSKFAQNKTCLDALMNTGDTIIVEASIYDKIWGIGMSIDDPDIHDQTKWKGKNLLGSLLMKVRNEQKTQFL